MKKILLTVFTVTISYLIFAADYTTTGNGTWSTNTIWSGNTIPPADPLSGRQIEISANNSVTKADATSFTYGSLGITVKSGAHLTFSNTFSSTGSGLKITVENGATVTFDGNATFGGQQVNFVVEDGGKINFNGNASLGGGTFMTIKNGSEINFNGGVTYGVSANITIEPGGAINVTANAAFGTSSFITINNQGTFYINTDLTIDGAIIKVEGSLVVNGNMISPVGSSNSTVSGTGSVVVAGTVPGTISVSASSTVISGAKIWTGDVSSVWANASNWSKVNGISSAPSGADPIAIPALGAGKAYPVLPATIDGNLTILAGGEATVNVATTIKGNLKIESNANGGTGTILKTGGSLAVNGTTTVQQYVTSGRYWFVASPMSTYTLTMPSGSQKWIWNESTQSYSTSGNVASGQGLVIKSGSTGIISFSGSPLNFGDATLNLTHDNTNKLYTDGQSYAGSNILGNPYPSFLDWDLVYTNNSGLSSTIWYRVNGAYQTYNATNGQSVPNSVSLRYIPPMQSVWAWVGSNKSVTLKNSYCVSRTATSNSLKADDTDTESDIFRISVENGKYSDEQVVLFNKNAEDGYGLWDSEKRFADKDSIPQLYSIIDTKKLVINGMQNIDTVKPIPLYFSTKVKGEFVLRSPQFEGFKDYRVLVKDKRLNTIIDFSKDSIYKFTSAIVADTNRFEITLKSLKTETALSQKENVKGNNIRVYTQGKSIVIEQSEVIKEGEAIVYDLSGKAVLFTNLLSGKTIINSDLPESVYYVVVKTGKTSTTKTVEIR